MKIYDYMTQGTCSQAIHIELNDDNTINNVSFTGGCNGNLKGIGNSWRECRRKGGGEAAWCDLRFQEHKLSGPARQRPQ